MTSCERSAEKNKLHEPDVLRAQTERLLADPKSRQFVDAFPRITGSNLRKTLATAPDANFVFPTITSTIC